MRQSSYAWSRAYARQAQADLDAREVLLGSKVSACQHLHFLQMACEKISKAHLCLGGTDPETLTHSHAFAAKVLPQIARELLRRAAFVADLEFLHSGIESMVRQLAREVDLLAPPSMTAVGGQIIASIPGKTTAVIFMCLPKTGSELSDRCTGTVRGRRF